MPRIMPKPSNGARRHFSLIPRSKNSQAVIGRGNARDHARGKKLAKERWLRDTAPTVPETRKDSVVADQQRAGTHLLRLEFVSILPQKLPEFYLDSCAFRNLSASSGVLTESLDHMRFFRLGKIDQRVLLEAFLGIVPESLQRVRDNLFEFSYRLIFVHYSPTSRS